MKENDSKNARMTNQQAQAQRECDVLAYHQSENLQSETRVCVKFGTSGLQWVRAGDELRGALKQLNEDNDKDCLVSISEFKGERLNESSVGLMKIFYVKLSTMKFRPSTKEEGIKIILDYCEANSIPEPSLIVHDGNDYIIKWILRDPLEGKYLEVWKQVQRYLAERFFRLSGGGYCLDDDGNDPKKKFIESHTNATAMLRVPGFLNSRTVELNLFTYNEETQLIYSSGQRYNANEIAVRLYLSKWEIEQYRSAKERCRGYLQKKKSKPAERTAEVPALTDEEKMSMRTALMAHHDVRGSETFIYVQRKNPDKHSRTDRTYYYDSYSTGELEKFLRRSDIDSCDFWATAAEYKLGFRKLKEKTIYRTKENGERYEEIRRQLPKREKWIEAIQLSFLVLDLRDSELGYIPTIEQAKELIYARCFECNVPKPMIVDNGDGYTLELRWIWRNAMKNCGERDNDRILYPKFNRKFDAMQEVLYRLFWYFGVDAKKLSATSMLSVVGTLNTKTGSRRSIAGEADEVLTYEELASRLGLNFGKVLKEKHEQQAPETVQPEQEEIQKRLPLEVAETMSRASEVIEPESPFTNFLTELAEYTDFEILMTKKNSQSQHVSATHETSEHQAEASELSAPEAQEIKTCPPLVKVANAPNGALDLLRLHRDSDYWVCICTQNKAKGERGKWTEYWTPASRVLEKLAELKRTIPDFEEYNVYVSQLQFKSDKNRKVENVAAFRACFIDIDGKEAGRGNLTAEEWKTAILKYCRAKKIPIPSEILFSGNGAHIKYFFKRLMPANELSRWVRLERKLVEMFKEIGADSHSTDGARVLRVEGTRNCKPETQDRDVRVIFKGEDYDFEEFAQAIEAFVLAPEAPSEPIRVPEAEVKADEPKSEKPAVKEKSCETKTAECSSVEAKTTNQSEGKKKLCVPSFYVSDATAGRGEFVSRSEIRGYLAKQDKSHRLECSVAEYSVPKREDRAWYIENLYFSYVVLTQCPGATFAKQLKNIQKRCGEYRGIGIPEPNRILRDGQKLILMWRYSQEPTGKYLPGIALPRWKDTQEFLNWHFEDWGAMEFSSVKKTTALFPLEGFMGEDGTPVRLEYENPETKYLFDDLAKVVLPFSQEESAEANAQKKANRSPKKLNLEDLTVEYVERRKAAHQQSRFSPALKIFDDLVKLLAIRAEQNGGTVPQGHREDTVFCAMNFAVIAGFVNVSDERDFNELAQRLIEKCGGTFAQECDPDTLVTLRNRFMGEQDVYRFQNETLIRRLDITAEEQERLKILKELPEHAETKAKKKRRIPEYEILGVSKAKYYRDRTKYKEVSLKLREVYARLCVLGWVIKEMRRAQGLLKLSIQMRLKKMTYYEGENGNGVWGVRHGCWSFVCRGKSIGSVSGRSGIVQVRVSGGVRRIVGRRYGARCGVGRMTMGMLGSWGRCRPPP